MLVLAFPATGKTVLQNCFATKKKSYSEFFKVVDFDVARFMVDPISGPNKLVSALIAADVPGALVLVTSFPAVAAELAARGHPFIAVYPERGTLHAWLTRAIGRGMPLTQAHMLADGWGYWFNVLDKTASITVAVAYDASIMSLDMDSYAKQLDQLDITKTAKVKRGPHART